MTNAALILITDPQRSLEDHAGLPLLKRTVLAAQKGGIEEFLMVVPENSEGRLKDLLSGDKRITSRIRWYRHENGNLSDSLRDISPESVLIIRAESVFDPDIIKKMNGSGLNNTSACVAVRNGSGRPEPGRCTLKLIEGVIVDCDAPGASHHTAGLILTRPGSLKSTPAGASDGHTDLCDVVKGLLRTGGVRALDVTDELCMEVDSQETMHESKRKLFERLGLITDSPFSYYVSRKLSGFASGALVKLPITPNQITLISFFTALLACWFYLQGGYWYSMTGALVFYASFILDLADGEVARLKYMSSKYGALFDSICDSISYSVILFCIALAIHRNADMPNILTVGVVAAGALFICTNLDTYIHLTGKDLWDNKPSPLERLFANEDCFLLSLFAFTLFDRLSWYLWIVAIGSIIYTLVLIGEMRVKKSSRA